MPVYDRGEPDDPAVINRFDAGFGWIAHPGERGQRVSHAVRGDQGVWLLDPLDAVGIEDDIDELGTVEGVAVLSNWHTRDAGVFANRYDVPVLLPSWMDRVSARVDAPIERYETTLGTSGFRVDRVDPLPGWHEGIAFRERDGTLYTPDILTTRWTVGSERVTLTLPCRVAPPRSGFDDLEPDRILVGHGIGTQEHASDALEDTIEGPRRRLPLAIIQQGPPLAAGIACALR